MKKIISLLLCALMLAASLPVMAETNEEPEWNKEYLNADFESVKSVSDYGFHLQTGSGHSEAIEEKDAEHGKSLRVKMPNGSTNLLYELEESNTESMVVRFSYFREGDSGQQIIFRYGSDEILSLEGLTQNDSKARFSFFSYEGRASLYQNERSYSRPLEDEMYVTEKQNEWNDVTIFFDYPHSEISYYFNDQLLQVKEVELINFYAIGITCNQGSDIWLDDISIHRLDRADKLGLKKEGVPEKLWDYSNRSVDVNLDSGFVGNVYTESDPVVMDTVFTERDGVGGNYKIVYDMKDEYGKTIWTGEDSFSLLPYQTVTKKIKPGMDKFGIYWLYATLTSDQGYTYETFTQLSKVNTPPRGYVNKKFGVNLHVGQGRPFDNTKELLKKAGVGVVRDGYAWWTYQLDAGDTFTPPEKAVPYFEYLAENDISLIHVMNPGLPTGTGAFGTESFLAGYEEWASYLASYFKSLGLDYALEVWNEWNHSGQYDPLDYGQVQKAMYKGAKRGDPDSIVVGGNTAGIPGSMLKTAFTPLNGEKVMDAASYHIYDYSKSGPETGSYVTSYDYYRNQLDPFGYTDVPIWVTEVGWSVSPGHATQTFQTQYMPRLMATTEADGLYDVVTVYNFVCKGVSPDLRESNFGMVESFFPSWEHPMPMAARGTYLAFANFNALHHDAAFVEELEFGDGIYCYRYKKESGKDMLFLVAGDGDKNIGLKLGCDDVAVYDIYGNVSQLSSVDGVFSLLADNRCIYIEGDFSEVTRCDPLFELTTNEITVAPGSRANIALAKKTDKAVEIVTENGGDAYVTAVDSFRNNAAKLYVATAPDADGNTDNNDVIYTSLFMDGKPVFYGITDITYSPSIAVQSFSMSPSSVLMDYWTGTLRLKSNQSDLALNGMLTFTSPNWVTELMGETNISNIIPGAVKSVPVILTGDMVGQQVGLKIELDNGEVVDLSTRLSSDVAHYAFVKPVIDGKVGENEWNLSHKVRIRGSDSTWIDVVLMWDEENAYFYGMVKDQYFMQQQTDPDGMWRQDSIQVAFVTDDKTSSSSELGFGKLADEDVTYMWTAETGVNRGAGVVEEVELKISRINAENTFYEARIPWSVVVGDLERIKAGNNIKFDFCLNNDDMAGRVYLEYSYAIVSSKDVSRLSPFLLSKEPW